MVQLVRQSLGALEIGVNEQADKLVTAITEDEVLSAQPGPQERRQLPQQFVARGMAIHVVRGLEPIHVEEGRHHSSRAGTARAFDLALGGDQSACPAQHAREVIEGNPLSDRVQDSVRKYFEIRRRNSKLSS